MKRHTVIGWQILRECESVYLRNGAEIALCHHEKWDGTGYPNALSGEEIPLSGRIVGLVDVFDALTSERPYKAAWSLEEARTYILQQRGKHFDPRLVDLFREHFEEVRSSLGR
jgi:response regulator RpfG family c-di-GMP phosphodiesterase